jgi:hypothetical protein
MTRIGLCLKAYPPQQAERWDYMQVLKEKEGERQWHRKELNEWEAVLVGRGLT